MLRLLSSPPLWRQLMEAALFAGAMKAAELAETLIDRALRDRSNETDRSTVDDAAGAARMETAK